MSKASESLTAFLSSPVPAPRALQVEARLAAHPNLKAPLPIPSPLPPALQVEARLGFSWHWETALGIQGSGDGELLLRHGSIDYVFMVRRGPGPDIAGCCHVVSPIVRRLRTCSWCAGALGL